MRTSKATTLRQESKRSSRGRPEPDFSDAHMKQLEDRISDIGQEMLRAIHELKQVIAPLFEQTERIQKILEHQLLPAIGQIRRAMITDTLGDQDPDTIRRVLLEVDRILRGLGSKPPMPVRVGPGSEAQIIGRANVMRAAIQLIEGIPEYAVDVANVAQQVYLTFQDDFDDLPIQRQDWMDALRIALRNGWNVVHLIRRREDASRALTVVRDILDLLGAYDGRGGHYTMMYLPEDIARTLPCEHVLVPGRGVIELFASNPEALVDSGVLYHPDHPKFSMLYKHLQGIQSKSRDVLSLFDRTGVHFAKEIAKTERKAGHRCLVLDGISESLVPMTIHEARGGDLVAKHLASQRDIDEILSAREQRQRTLEDQLDNQHCQVIDLCPRSAIRRLVDEGVYSLDDSFTTLGARSLTLEERVEVLKNVIEHLDRFPTYDFGLVDASRMENDHSLWPSFWLVKQHTTVLLETWRRDAVGNRQQIDLQIIDSVIADAFYKYFDQFLWQGLPPENKDRAQVKAWLQGQIADLQQQIQSAEGDNSHTRDE